jgi:hypothetical protein
MWKFHKDCCNIMPLKLIIQAFIHKFQPFSNSNNNIQVFKKIHSYCILFYLKNLPYTYLQVFDKMFFVQHIALKKKTLIFSLFLEVEI